MQIIQSIRDKGAAIIIVVIALSLIGFILMDAKQGSSASFFGGSNDNLGKVNGEKITLEYFNKRMNETRAAEVARSGQEPDAARTNQMRDQVWNQIVAEKVFFKETAKLGITLTPQEISALLLSNDPANPLMQERDLIDPASGKLDIAKAQQAYDNIRKLKGEQRAKVDAQMLEPLKLSTAVSKYSGLLNASAYYPTWMKERDANEAKSFATISYVSVPYNVISDSAVSVSDADVTDYVKKHKDLFKQEAGRTISYVSFSQNPTAEDSARTRKMLDEQKAAFAVDTNAKVFTAKNTSSIEFKDEFFPKSKIASSAIDTIVRQPVGAVYGPYVDGKNLVLAKIIGTKTVPDSVKVRHILIGTVNPQTGESIMVDSVAKKLADSVLAAVNSGADFNLLTLKYSTDEGSKAKGGVYENVYYGQMVPEFNDFIFTKPTGSRDVVKTQFGYHVMEVLNQKGSSPAYKIAFLGKEITPSDATINNASLEATRASAQKDRKTLEAYLKGKALIQNPTVIKENDYAFGNMQDARQLIKWAFGAKKGNVSEPFSIGDDYVVAVVDNVYEEGTQDAATARKNSEAVIRNEKKSEIIIKNLGANPTLEAAAAKYNQQVGNAGADSSITMASQLINGLGVEYKVIGAAFNKDNQAKVSAPFAGTSAVYLVKTNSIQNKADMTEEAKAQAAQQKQSAIRNQAGNWFEALRKQADVKDKRSNVF